MEGLMLQLRATPTVWDNLVGKYWILATPQRYAKGKKYSSPTILNNSLGKTKFRPTAVFFFPRSSAFHAPNFCKRDLVSRVRAIGRHHDLVQGCHAILFPPAITCPMWEKEQAPPPAITYRPPAITHPSWHEGAGTLICWPSSSAGPSQHRSAD
jgi:hypothetical protein